MCRRLLASLQHQPSSWHLGWLFEASRTALRSTHTRTLSPPRMSLRGLWRAYERLLSAKPIPTQMATSAVLWCAGDALAQLTAHVEASVYGSNHNAPSTSTSSLQPQREPQQHVGKQPATAPPHAPPSQSINQQQQQQQQPGSTPADQHQQQFVLDRRRIALTSAFGAGFIGPVGHVWRVLLFFFSWAHGRIMAGHA